jgi:hypothetical protein
VIRAVHARGRRSEKLRTYDGAMRHPRQVLILGASYGSLLAAKLLAAGHHATLVCRAATADLINVEGIRLQLPVKGSGTIELDSRKLPGRLYAAAPRTIEPDGYDLVVLAMSEPQYGAPGVRELLDRVAKARRPCLSIMNMPPPAYLRRVVDVSPEVLRPCYTDPTVWQHFDPACVSLCSPDPQALRTAGGPLNVVRVTLATNFKAARFESETHTAILRELEEDIEGASHQGQTLPVKLKVHESLFVPLAKWAMLLTGNYRCVAPQGARSIRDAVHSDLEQSRQVYEWVRDLCVSLGAAAEDLVPFEKYAAAANQLSSPSAAARALAAGATNIERVDRIVQALAAQKGLRHPIVDDTVALIDARLAENRQAAA